MARPLRLEFPGALYHVTSRGNARESIFVDDTDRRQFLEVLDRVCGRTRWRIRAWCQMGNHYHLLLETPEANLSAGMRQLNGTYTQRFNRRHGRVGHVLQGRYKAIVVDRDSYLLEVTRYVLLNPVRAGLVRHASHWPWSSYRSTLGLADAPDWLAVEDVLATFGRNRAAGIVALRRFIDAGVDAEAPWVSLRNQIFLGSEDFIERMGEQTSICGDSGEIPFAQRRGRRPTLAELVAATGQRDEAIRMAWHGGGYSLREIGAWFGLHYSRVSRIVAAGGARERGNRKN